MKKIVWYLSALVLACALIVAGTGAKEAKAADPQETQKCILFSVDESEPVSKTFGECAEVINNSENAGKKFTMTLCGNITSEMIDEGSDSSRYIDLQRGNELTLDFCGYSIESGNGSRDYIIKVGEYDQIGKLTVNATSGGAISHTGSGKDAIQVTYKGTATLNGGSFSKVTVQNGAEIYIRGGSFDEVALKGYDFEAKLSGGTFAKISRDSGSWTSIVEPEYAMADGSGKLIGPYADPDSTLTNLSIVAHGSNDHQPYVDYLGRVYTSGSADDSQHWKDCAACGEGFDCEQHTWNNGECTVCGYTHENHVDADNNGFCDVCGKKHGVHTDADGNGVCDICGTTEFNFRDSSGVFYDSVQDADNAGTAGRTLYLTLLRDINVTKTSDINNCNFVIDMDRYKVTLTANYWLRPQSGSTVDLTIKNGTIEGGYYQIESYTTGTVTLDHITSSGSSRVISANSSPDIVILDCVLEGGNSSDYILNYNSSAANLTILRSRLNGKDSAVKFNTINNGADSGVLIKDSDLTARGSGNALYAEGNPSQGSYPVRIENSHLKSENGSALQVYGTLSVEVTDSVIERIGNGGSLIENSGAIYLHNNVACKVTGGRIVNTGSAGCGISGYASNVQIVGTEVSGTSHGLLLTNINASDNIKLGGRFSSIKYATSSDVTIGASLPEGTDVYEYDFEAGTIGEKITDSVRNLKEITVPCIIRCSGEHSYDHGRCTVCGYEHTDHTFDGGTVAVAATYDAVGDKVYTCTVCGFERHEEIAKLVRSSYSSESYSAPAAPAAEKKEEGKKQEDKKEEKKESKEQNSY